MERWYLWDPLFQMISLIVLKLVYCWYLPTMDAYD